MNVTLPGQKERKKKDLHHSLESRRWDLTFFFLSDKHEKTLEALKRSGVCTHAFAVDRVDHFECCPYLHLCNKMTETGEGDPRFDRRSRHDYKQLTRKGERLHRLSVHFRTGFQFQISLRTPLLTAMSRLSRNTYTIYRSSGWRYVS